MYYFIKTKTLNSLHPVFMTGGMVTEDFNPLIHQHRSVTNDFAKALEFKTINEAQIMQARQFTLVELVSGEFVVLE